MDRRSRIGFCWSEMTVLAAVFWFVLSIRPGLAEQPLTAPPGLGPEARAAVQAIHRLHRPRDVTALTGEERTLRELELATARVKRALLYTATRIKLAEAEESLELAEAEFARWGSIRSRVGTGAASAIRGRRGSGQALDAQLGELQGAIEVSIAEARDLVGALRAETAAGASRSSDQVKTSSQHQRAASAFLHRHKRKTSHPPVPYRSALVVSNEGKPVRLDAENPRFAPRSVAGTSKPAQSHPLTESRFEMLPDRVAELAGRVGSGRPGAGSQEIPEEGLP